MISKSLPCFRTPPAVDDGEYDHARAAGPLLKTFLFHCFGEKFPELFQSDTDSVVPSCAERIDFIKHRIANSGYVDGHAWGGTGPEYLKLEFSAKPVILSTREL